MPIASVGLTSMNTHIRRRTDDGFTLIELMVVVLIIAILIAIAIPTFLGARRRAQDRQAQGNLRNALTAEKAYYSDEQAYTNVVADLTTYESGMTFLTSGTALAKNAEVLVELGVSDDQIVCLTTLSASGTTFVLGDIASHPNPTHTGAWYHSSALAQCSLGNLITGRKGSW
jgi:type IV pilus assembly protein PilA